MGFSISSESAEGLAMKPRERPESGEQHLFRARLDQIIDIHHLVKPGSRMNWKRLEAVCAEAYAGGPGTPPLPTPLMAGLAILPVVRPRGGG